MIFIEDHTTINCEIIESDVFSPHIIALLVILHMAILNLIHVFTAQYNTILGGDGRKIGGR